MGRPLTYSYLQHKIGSQSTHEVKQLNLWGHDYEDVSLLSMLPNLQVLQLSKNKVGTLQQISKCKQLKELYLTGNNIQDIEELELLRELYNLRVLNLIENPITNHPEYKRTVLKYCMALQELDEVTVKDSDRQSALETEIYTSIQEPIIVKPQFELLHESSFILAPGFMKSKGKNKKNFETPQIKQSPNQSTEKSSGQQRKINKYEQKKIIQSCNQQSPKEDIKVDQYFLDVAFGLTKYLDKNALLCLQKTLQEEIPQL